jgi:death on curing protein
LRVEPRWLKLSDVINTNREEVEETGEPHLVLDLGLLESACERPKHLWHYGGESDVVRLAVSLLYGIAANHPFQQGNKRTALNCAIQFIELNGYVWTMADSEDLAYWVLRLVEHGVSEDEFAELIRPGIATL